MIAHCLTELLCARAERLPAEAIDESMFDAPKSPKAEDDKDYEHWNMNPKTSTNMNPKTRVKKMEARQRAKHPPRPKRKSVLKGASSS